MVVMTARASASSASRSLCTIEVSMFMMAPLEVFVAFPAFQVTRLQIKQIQYSSDTVVDQIIDCLWLSVEGGHRRRNHSA